MKTICSIQFLRGFAAILVLVEHLRIETSLVPYGSVGVDLFFIISGFIIFHVTRSDSKNFMIKRLIRIVPLYWLATLVVTVLVLARPSLFNNTEFSTAHLFGSLLFVPHWTDAQGLRPILALGWTLNYEMMFYLLFYIAMRLSHRYRLEITATFLFSLWAASNLLSQPETGFHFFSDSIYLEFIAGMAFAKYSKIGLVRGISAYALLAASTLAFFAISIAAPFGLRILDYGIASALLFVGALSVESIFAGRLLGFASVFGGQISYSLYLSHIYIMGIIARLLDVHGVGLWISCFVLIPAIAWSIYRWIEAPLGSLLRKVLLAQPRIQATADST